MLARLNHKARKARGLSHQVKQGKGGTMQKLAPAVHISLFHVPARKARGPSRNDITGEKGSMRIPSVNSAHPTFPRARAAQPQGAEGARPELIKPSRGRKETCGTGPISAYPTSPCPCAAQDTRHGRRVA